jgi:hypothetical protein
VGIHAHGIGGAYLHGVWRLFKPLQRSEIISTTAVGMNAHPT